MSKWIMYGYKCDTCDTAFESLEKPETTEVECQECGATALRSLSPGAQCDLMQWGLRYEGHSAAHGRFEKARHKQRERERKFLRDHGTEFDRTPGG